MLALVPARDRQISIRSPRRLLDEAVQQNHPALLVDIEEDPCSPTLSEIGSYFVNSFAQRPADRHPDRPAEFDGHDVLPDPPAVVPFRQRLQPVPNGLPTTFSSKEDRGDPLACRRAWAGLIHHRSECTIYGTPLFGRPLWYNRSTFIPTNMADNRQVFISHIYEERSVADVLQKYIRRGFRGELPVFAAFDRESIGGGKKWFTHIVDNLDKSAVVLVLLSHESRRRQWINFEAGYGGGAGAEVVPVSIRNFSLGKLEFPLLGFQGRSIDDISGILADVTNTLHIPSERVDLDAYLQEIREAEAKLIYKSLNIHPFVQGNALQFELTNNGNADIELLMLEAYVPKERINPRSLIGASNFVQSEAVRRNNIDYWWFACTSTRGTFGYKPQASLRPILTPTMGTTSVAGMAIPLTEGNLQASNSRPPIFYQIHAIDHPTEMESTPWDDLERR